MSAANRTPLIFQAFSTRPSAHLQARCPTCNEPGQTKRHRDHLKADTDARNKRRREMAQRG